MLHESAVMKYLIADRCRVIKDFILIAVLYEGGEQLQNFMPLVNEI